MNYEYHAGGQLHGYKNFDCGDNEISVLDSLY